jgi:type VI secretion system protein ImpH
VRFSQPPSLAFAPSAQDALEPRGQGLPPRLAVHFMGLFGPNGPLPRHLTEYAHERQRHAGDAAFARFADLFHHRMLSLFFRAWASSQPAVDGDRPESSAYARWIGALAGQADAAPQAAEAPDAAAALFFAGHFAAPGRHPEGLQAVVAGVFGLPVAVEELIGEWIGLPDDGCCRLGRSPDTGLLGVNALAGTRAWSAQHKLRLRLGPLGRADYERFLPGQPALRRLQALVRRYLGREFAWELQLVLRREDVPPARLGGTRLGWTAWLGRRDAAGDADDLRLEPEAPAAAAGAMPTTSSTF